jgi:hypothetical protein
MGGFFYLCLYSTYIFENVKIIFYFFKKPFNILKSPKEIRFVEACVRSSFLVQKPCEGSSEGLYALEGKLSFATTNNQLAVWRYQEKIYLFAAVTWLSLFEQSQATTVCEKRVKVPW